MKANENHLEIKHLEIKVLIKSSYNSKNNQYSYDLFLSPHNVSYEILSLSFETLCKQFIITGLNTGLFDNPKEELELTNAFCVYANRIFTKFHYSLGNANECTENLHSLKRKVKSKISSCRYGIFIRDISRKRESLIPSKEVQPTREYELLMDLRNSIDWKDETLVAGCRQWQFNLKYTFDYVFQPQFNKYLILNRYRYSLVVHSMIKSKQIELDSFVPILCKYDIVDYSIAESNDDFLKLFWAEPSSLFEKDAYPLDIALSGKNAELLFSLLKMGASKFSDKIRFATTRTSTSEMVIFMFESAQNYDEFEIILNFMHNNSNYIDNQTRIVTESSTNGYSSREKIFSKTGEDIIKSWYRCALRLQNIECLDILLDKYRRQLLGLLYKINPYTGKPLSWEKEKPTINMELEINKYVQKYVVPYIKMNQFRSVSYKDYGIWGFDAQTGRPIYESELYV